MKYNIKKMGCGANLKETKQAEVLYLRLDKHDVNKQRQMLQQQLKNLGIENYIIPKVPINLDYSYKTAKRLEEEEMKTNNKELNNPPDKANISVQQLAPEQNEIPITFSNMPQNQIISNASTLNSPIKNNNPVIQDPIQFLENNNNQNNNINILNKNNIKGILIANPTLNNQTNPIINFNGKVNHNEEYKEGEYEGEEYEEGEYEDDEYGDDDPNVNMNNN